MHTCLSLVLLVLMGSALQFPEGSKEVRLLGWWPKLGSEKCLVAGDGLSIVPCATFSTPTDCSSAAGNWYCCMRGFFLLFYVVAPPKKARRAFTSRCLEVPIHVYCASQLQSHRVFNPCKDVDIRDLEIMSWVLKKLMVVLDGTSF